PPACVPTMSPDLVHSPAVAALPGPLQSLVRRFPRLTWLTLFLWRLGERWGQDQCALIAAALAFFGLLSVFPLVLAVVAILGQTVVGNQVLLREFKKFIAGFFPGAAGQIMNVIEGIAAKTDTATLSIVAILLLIWNGRALFDTLAWVLNSIWPRTTPRTFLQHQIVLWSTFLGASVLWLLSTGMTFALSAVNALTAELPEFFGKRYPVVVDVLARVTAWNLPARLASWLLTTLMFWLIYRFLPNVTTRQRRRIVLGAALIASIGWELAKFAFTQFLGNITRYERTYGSVAGVVITMMWIYFASLILLLGAEAAAAFEDTCATANAPPEAQPAEPQINS
ncbi:MAG: YihY/virulence factor BrkB family protein, partial [Armatimonadota bacterium]|nr:YihY/virulence factor BrkB family protein [Armatimonadota bacterium]